MSALSSINQNDLRNRLESVLSSLDILFKDIGPKLQEIGSLREEAALIYEELKERGVIKSVPESNGKEPSI